MYIKQKKRNKMGNGTVNRKRQKIMQKTENKIENGK